VHLGTLVFTKYHKLRKFEMDITRRRILLGLAAAPAFSLFGVSGK
jgi:hypothetical protein